MNTINGLRQSWVAAEDDLGIEVELLTNAVLIRGFGSADGMLCAVPETSEERAALRQQADVLGTSCSQLGPSYLTYDRAHFIDTLNDWGWHGVGDPPSWYTGEPWSV